MLPRVIQQWELTNVSMDHRYYHHSIDPPVPHPLHHWPWQEWQKYRLVILRVNYVKYYLSDHSVQTQYYSKPFWAYGDNDGVRVNAYDALAVCGTKSLKVVFHSWRGGDEFPCDTQQFTLKAKCAAEPPPTVAPPPPFECPMNSKPKSMFAPTSFSDCKCDDGFQTSGLKCVEVCLCLPTSPLTAVYFVLVP